MKGLVIRGKLDSLVITLTHLWFQMQRTETQIQFSGRRVRGRKKKNVVIKKSLM